MFLFLQYATKEEGDEMFMSYHDLILRYLQLMDASDFDEYTLSLFASSVDTTRDGYEQKCVFTTTLHHC